VLFRRGPGFGKIPKKWVKVRVKVRVRDLVSEKYQKNGLRLGLGFLVFSEPRSPSKQHPVP